MSRVILTERAQSDLTRLYAFLERADEKTALDAIDSIILSFELLETIPLGAPLVDGRDDIRKLVVNQGKSGYLAFYEYDYLTDTVVIATIMHQREQYFFEAVGKT